MNYHVQFKLIITIINLLLTHKFNAQDIKIFEGKGVNEIRLGISTTDDVVKEFGSNYRIMLSEENIKILKYPSIGLVFQCYDSTELIIGIAFEKSFKGITSNGLALNMNSITNGALLNYFPNLKWRTSDASEYWSLSNESISFYTKKDTSIPVYPLNDKIYNSKIVDSALIKLNDFSLIQNETKLLTYYRPLYAPQNSNHLNAGIPVSYTDKIIKVGIWKEYFSNHNLKSTGYFDDNRPIGKHEYFDKNGKLISTINYGQRTHYLFYLIILCIMAITGIFIVKFIRNNETKPNHLLYLSIGLGLHVILYLLFPVGCGGSGLAIIISVPFIIILSLVLLITAKILNRFKIKTKYYFIVCLAIILITSYYTVPFCPRRSPLELLRDALPL